MSDTKPNPGSDEALAQNCLCPVFDNGHGMGAGWRADDGSPIFWITETCPLHGSKPEPAQSIESETT